MKIEVLRSNRKTMGLQMKRQGTLLVRVPKRTTDKQVKQFIAQHRGWIDKYWQKYQRYPGLPESYYRDQGCLWILGVAYTIEVITSSKASIRRQESKLMVYTPKLNEEAIAQQINRWKRNFANHFLANRLAFLHQQSCEALPEYRFKLRKMTRQWGNCSHDGEIKLNLNLIRYPEACIDGVIWHELCHLIHFHHGSAFYHLLGRLNPQWQQHKVQLERFSG